MNYKRSLLLFSIAALPLTLLALAAKKPDQSQDHRIARGKYLVQLGGCHDCHTRVKLTLSGPVPDLARYMSGHPANANFPHPPKLALYE